MATRDRATVQAELNEATEALRVMERDGADADAIAAQVEIRKSLAAELAGMVRVNLQKLQGMPGYSVVHGQAVDVRETMKAERLLLRELTAIVEGRSVYQGPDVVV